MPTKNRRSNKQKATWGGMKNERGMTLVFVALGFMAFVAATMLAIDVGMLMTARSQAQNSADAGALAGAVALGFNDYKDRTPAGPAVTSALSASRSTANGVMYDPKDPKTKISVEPDDVVFENDPTGEPNRVKVTVYRTGFRGNPVSTIIAGIFGINTADIAATATAEVSKANAMDCVKPFTIPDRWKEADKGGALSSDPDTFEAYDKKGKPLPNPDVYIPSDQPGYTGYNADRDKGMPLMIRAGTGNEITPSFYFSITIGGGGGPRGADEYRWNIANCNQTVMKPGELMIQEPGNQMGPTTQGAKELWDKDKNAYWDTGCNCIKGSDPKYGAYSPRVFPIPIYDPDYYAEGKRNGRYADLKVANWIGFFLDKIDGNNIWGRITPIAGLRTGDPVPDGAFPIAIRLIK